VEHGLPVITELRWGLVTSSSKDEKIAYSLINARSETVAEKPAFRSAFKKRRCLIPADGFYEWHALGAKLKQPWRFVRLDRQPFQFAGLWDHWRNPDDADAEPLETFTVLTTTPNRVAAPIHDRMPVILDGGGAKPVAGRIDHSRNVGQSAPSLP
jgi:putative SOS response-associated peptidase YedK